MTPKFTPRLRVEALEARETPSVTVSFTSGTLSIRGDNTANNLGIVETTPGKFAVTANSKSLGTFAVTNLSINMGSANDTVDLGVKTSLPGWLRVDLGSGDDSFTTKNNSVIGATIGGAVNISTGLSTPKAAGYDEVVELYDLTFTGPSVQVTGSSGSSAEQLDLQSAVFNNALLARNIKEIDAGLPENVTGAVTNGSLVVDNSLKNTDSRVNAPNGAGNVLFMFSGSKITNSLTYSGGSGRDDVDLPGDVTGVANVSIGGNVTVVGREGVNTLALGNGTFGATVGGSVSFIGGSNVDRFFFDSGSSVAGSVNITLFGGNNQLFGDSTTLGAGPFDPTGAATVGGSMSISLGDGNNFIGTYVGEGTTLSVTGGVSITAGNGNNLGGIAATPGTITFFNPNVTIGGTAFYTAGKGSQHLDITNASLANLRITLGGGANTIDFSIPTFSGNVVIDFGTGPGPKGFETDAIPTTFTGSFLLRNYP